MSKIVTAINAMISNSDLISDAKQGDMKNEVFFKYDNKHVWSIISDNGVEEEFHLHYYPENKDINALASIPSEHWHESNIKSVAYSSDVLGTREALDSLIELHSVVQEKVYGMDSILDDIIGKGQF